MGAETQAELLASLLEATAGLRALGVITVMCGVVAMVCAVASWLLSTKPVALGALPSLWVAGVVFIVWGAVLAIDAGAEVVRLPEVVREAPHLLSALEADAQSAASRDGVLRFVDGGLALIGVALATRRGRVRGFGLALVAVTLLALGLDHRALELHERQAAVLSALSN